MGSRTCAWPTPQMRASNDGRQNLSTVNALERGQFLLTIVCADRPGIVYAVSSFLVQRECTIVQSQQYGDPETGLFFMRVHFEGISGPMNLESLRQGFASVGDSFSMEWQLRRAQDPERMLIMVSRFGHCLNDLLFRHSIGALPVAIPAVVSNHRDFEGLVESYGIPFIHLPITPDTKAAAEASLLEIVRQEQVDFVVLARYMQVLSDAVCRELQGRVINIHHSFLPSFKGARPYQQAHGRGVKLIGATAHYVTADLDEGPIIEQEITRVNHSLDAKDLEAAGRDVECRALTKAVTWHAESRVLLNGGRTVVFT